ncbi:MAG: FtsX-like permease family protein [Mariprofundales bacterium]
MHRWFALLSFLHPKNIWGFLKSKTKRHGASSNKRSQQAQDRDRVIGRLPGGYHLPPLGMSQMLAGIIVAIALWTLTLVWLGLDAASQWTGTWQQEISFHIYLEPQQRDDVTPMLLRLQANANIAEARVLKDDEERAWLMSWLGTNNNAEDSQHIADNLPISIEIIPAEGCNHDKLFKWLQDETTRFGMDVNPYEASLARAHHWMSRIRYLTLFVTVLISLAMAIIISNALRMILLARRNEILLMRLLGADEWFIRMPFVLEGLLIGACAGLGAWLLMWPLLLSVSDMLSQLGVVLNGFIPLLPLLVGGAFTGGLGALLATSSVDIVDIEPSV